MQAVCGNQGRDVVHTAKIGYRSLGHDLVHSKTYWYTITTWIENEELFDLSVAAEGVVLALEEALRHLCEDSGFRVWGFSLGVWGV